MTILQVALNILSDSDEPLSPREIHKKISERELYTFKAKDPIAVVSAALRKALKKETLNMKLRRTTDGRYELQ